MKKLLLISALLAGASTMMAYDLQIQKPTNLPAPTIVKATPTAAMLTPATNTIITQVPAGSEQLMDMVWSSTAYYPDNQQIVSAPVDGFAAQIVVNGNKMYIHNPLTLFDDYGADAWIEGTISGETVTFKTPQAYWMNGTDMAYATRVTTSGVDANNLDIVFSYKNGELTQTDGGILMLTNVNGQMFGYGDGNIKVTKISDPKVELPSTVTPESYILNFKREGKPMTITALLGFDGNDVYFSDPVGTGAWFKGTKDGDKITVKTGQYLGSSSGYPLWVCTGRMFTYMETDPYLGETYEVTDYEVTPNVDIVFTINGDIISTDQLLFINSSKTEKGIAYQALMAPSYEPWTPTAITPAAPWIDGFFDLSGYGFPFNILTYTIPSYGTEGQFIPQEYILYTIWFDDEPLEFYDTTQIPYYGQFVDYETMVSMSLSADDPDQHQLQLPYGPTKTISIQSFYEFNNELIPSQKVTVTLAELEDPDYVGAVEGIAADKEVANVVYFDLAGRQVEAAEGAGILVKVTVFADGTKATEKVIF